MNMGDKTGKESQHQKRALMESEALNFSSRKVLLFRKVDLVGVPSYSSQSCSSRIFLLFSNFLLSPQTGGRPQACSSCNHLDLVWDFPEFECSFPLLNKCILTIPKS